MSIYNWMCLLDIPGLFTGLFGFVRLQMKQNRAVKDGLRAILRDRMLQSFRHCSARGFADSDERQNFENLYIQYHSLGGNGVMDDVRQKFFALPLI